MRPLESYPYIGSVMLLTHTPQQDRASTVTAMRERGFPEFDITERDANGKFQSASLRSSYMPIRAIEPFGPLSALLMGYDAASEPQLVPTINRAATSGTVTASAPIGFMQPKPSLLIFKAVYQGRYMPEETSSRQAQLLGMMVLELPSEFIADLIAAHPEFEISLRHRDDQSRDAEPFYHRTRLAGAQTPISWWPRWTVRRTLDLFGQPFELTLSYQIGTQVIQEWHLGLTCSPSSVSSSLAQRYGTGVQRNSRPIVPSRRNSQKNSASKTLPKPQQTGFGNSMRPCSSPRYPVELGTLWGLIRQTSLDNAGQMSFQNGWTIQPPCPSPRYA